MLGKPPESLGHIHEGHRAGIEQVRLRKLLADRDLPHLQVTSRAFAHGKRMPAGRNLYLQHAWLPPEPPPGHGEHRYVFQLFPMSTLPQISPGLGRKKLTAAILQHATAGEPAEPRLVPG